MKGDDVGFAELNPRKLSQVCTVGRSVHATDSAGERLRGIGFARPSKHLGQEGDYAGGLVFQFFLRIAAGGVGAGLVPKVPGEDAVGLWERPPHTLDGGLPARN